MDSRIQWNIQNQRQMLLSKYPETKVHWKEDWEPFLSSHPGFKARDVNWEEKLEEDAKRTKIRSDC